jgi:hypothetical protein
VQQNYARPELRIDRGGEAEPTKAYYGYVEESDNETTTV